MELVYDASGNVMESKTLSAAGKLMERVQYIRRPGFYAPQQISTGYWPDGKSVRTRSEMNYDENANFTREIIRTFGQSGKQTEGIKLTHDPFTGIYTCCHWDVKAAAYQSNKCPSGEGSSEGPEANPELTYAEVMKELSFARQARVEQQKVERMSPMTPVTPPITTESGEIDVILPADLRPGDRVSGSVVENAGNYNGVPGIHIVPMRLPFESQGAAASLRGWTFEAAGSGRQLANGPVTFTVPAGKPGFNITLREVGNPTHAVSRRLAIAKTRGNSRPQQPRDFESAAICLMGSLCAVRAPLSGDSTKTFAAVGSSPAPIVAETSDTAYIAIPGKVQPGPSHLIVADGLLVAALPVDVAAISFRPARRQLKKGESMIVYAKLSGPEELPDRDWKAGMFPPAVSLEKARSLVPGFELPQESKEGLLLLVIRNATPGPISLRSSKNQTFAFKLSPDSFERGEFRYKFVADALQSGRFKLEASLLPFLAPVRGQQFSLRPGAAK
ncbi:MAG TPA: hypothetical protein VMX16_16405 [Terriglobia bacterium]|nr:hypothetical protein [Terriglobia bacterium]